MSWVASLVPGVLLVTACVQVACLIAAACSDVALRLIPDWACVGLGVAGAASRLATGPLGLAESVAVAAVLFLAMLPLHARGVLGGGDVKLLAAAALGQSLAGAVQFASVTAIAGGVLALIHLALRRLPRPAAPAPAGSSTIRRVLAAERWRILRRGSLPYGIAIAVGGLWVVLIPSGG